MRCYGQAQPATSAFEAPAPETMAGRVAVVLLAVAILIVTLVLAGRLGSSSFFHGFLVAVGVFLSIDIVVVHWIFRLHRVTAGPEANVIEPILVAAGAAFVIYGLRRERRSSGGSRRRQRGWTASDVGSPHGPVDRQRREGRTPR
jgi:Predicted membrane protein (DUF2243)